MAREFFGFTSDDLRRLAAVIRKLVKNSNSTLQGGGYQAAATACEEFYAAAVRPFHFPIDWLYLLNSEAF